MGPVEHTGLSFEEDIASACLVCCLLRMDLQKVVVVVVAGREKNADKDLKGKDGYSSLDCMDLLALSASRSRS